MFASVFQALTLGYSWKMGRWIYQIGNFIIMEIYADVVKSVQGVTVVSSGLLLLCIIDSSTTTFQTSWCNWRCTNLTQYVLCFTVKSVCCISPLSKTLQQIVTLQQISCWQVDNRCFDFCNVHRNIIIQYKQTKCTFSKLILEFLIFNVFYVFWNRGFIFRKIAVYGGVV